MTTVRVHTGPMADPGHRGADADPAVVRLVVDYVHCPQCDLIVPAFTGPEPLAAVLDGSMTRCGFCKWLFPPGPRLPLEVRHRCSDCGTAMRAPAGAAVVACRLCETWFHNPELDPVDRERVEQVLEEQQRIAAKVDRFLAATEHLLPPPPPPAEPPWTLPAPPRPASHGPSVPPLPVSPGLSLLPGAAASPGQPVLPALALPAPPVSSDPSVLPGAPASCGRPVPALPGAGLAGSAAGYLLPRPRSAESLPGNVRVLPGRRRPGERSSMRMTEAFPVALNRALRDVLGSRQRQVLELRYGLDGRPGRSFREIGAVIHRSPGRARAVLDQAVRTLAGLAREADLNNSRQHVSCSIVVHVARHAIGDPLDPAAAARIRAFVEVALPQATPDAATDLLLRLAGLRDELARAGRDRALRRDVTAATPALN